MHYRQPFWKLMLHRWRSIDLKISFQALRSMWSHLWGINFQNGNLKCHFKCQMNLKWHFKCQINNASIAANFSTCYHSCSVIDRLPGNLVYVRKRVAFVDDWNTESRSTIQYFRRKNHVTFTVRNCSFFCSINFQLLCRVSDI